MRHNLLERLKDSTDAFEDFIDKTKELLPDLDAPHTVDSDLLEKFPGDAVHISGFEVAPSRGKGFTEVTPPKVSWPRSAI